MPLVLSDEFYDIFEQEFFQWQKIDLGVYGSEKISGLIINLHPRFGKNSHKDFEIVGLYSIEEMLEKILAVENSENFIYYLDIFKSFYRQDARSKRNIKENT